MSQRTKAVKLARCRACPGLAICKVGYSFSPLVNKCSRFSVPAMKYIYFLRFAHTFTRSANKCRGLCTTNECVVELIHMEAYPLLFSWQSFWGGWSYLEYLEGDDVLAHFLLRFEEPKKTLSQKMWWGREVEEKKRKKPQGGGVHRVQHAQPSGDQCSSSVTSNKRFSETFKEFSCPSECLPANPNGEAWVWGRIPQCMPEQRG